MKKNCRRCFSNKEEEEEEREKCIKWDKGEGIKWQRRGKRSKTDALDLCIHKVDIHVAILNDFFYLEMFFSPFTLAFIMRMQTMHCTLKLLHIFH